MCVQKFHALHISRHGYELMLICRRYSLPGTPFRYGSTVSLLPFSWCILCFFFSQTWTRTCHSRDHTLKLGFKQRYTKYLLLVIPLFLLSREVFLSGVLNEVEIKTIVSWFYYFFFKKGIGAKYLLIKSERYFISIFLTVFLPGLKSIPFLVRF